jgi:DNA-binding GntR family transcriptional regulator
MARDQQNVSPVAVKLSMVRSPSLADQAADAIVTGIAAGVLKPGQRLIETELASLLNMSRVPLREALKILEAQGIVESIPHRGTSIALFGDDRFNNICAARIALERLALASAAPRYKQDPPLLENLDHLIWTMEKAASRLEWIDVSRADLNFHREICRVSGNQIVLTLWETLARHVFIVFGHEIRDERDAAVIGPQHRKLRDLLAAGDTKALHSDIERHILRIRLKVSVGKDGRAA